VPRDLPVRRVWLVLRVQQARPVPPARRARMVPLVQREQQARKAPLA